MGRVFNKPNISLDMRPNDTARRWVVVPKNKRGKHKFSNIVY